MFLRCVTQLWIPWTFPRIKTSTWLGEIMESVELTACEGLIQTPGYLLHPSVPSYSPISCLASVSCPCYPSLFWTGCFSWLCSPVACYPWLLHAQLCSVLQEVLPCIFYSWGPHFHLEPLGLSMSTPTSLSVLIQSYGYACFNLVSNMLSITVLLLPPACYTHLIIPIWRTSVVYFGKIKPCVEVFFFFLSTLWAKQAVFTLL